MQIINEIINVNLFIKSRWVEEKLEKKKEIALKAKYKKKQIKKNTTNEKRKFVC